MKSTWRLFAMLCILDEICRKRPYTPRQSSDVVRHCTTPHVPWKSLKNGSGSRGIIPDVRTTLADNLIGKKLKKKFKGNRNL